MAWIKAIVKTMLLSSLLLVVVSCTITGFGLAPISSIDYSRVKTVQIDDFANHAEYVYGPLATAFNDKLKDLFMQQTRLQLVSSGGDLVIDGEITGYNQYNEAIDASGYSSKVKLTLTIVVNYQNTKNEEDNFSNRTFTAFQTYDSSRLLTEVQDELITILVKDIAEQIYNSTVANW